jgi:hypothetical protein
MRYLSISLLMLRFLEDAYFDGSFAILPLEGGVAVDAGKQSSTT